MSNEFIICNDFPDFNSMHQLEVMTVLMNTIYDILIESNPNSNLLKMAKHITYLVINDSKVYEGNR